MNIIGRGIRKVAGPLKPVAEAAARSLANRAIEKVKVDPRISYPSYRSMDEFIDLEKLKSLNGYLTERIEAHYKNKEDELFHTGIMTIENSSAKKPGSRIIYLSKSDRDFNYMDLANPERWQPHEDSKEFPLLMDFIKTLPFKGTARMMIMYDQGGKPVTAHRDHVSSEVLHEFIWFRTNMNKPFYMLNQKTNEKQYVTSHSAWFDSVNQFHGADAHDGLSVSIRVDGIFSDEFRKLIPVPQSNKASTPSLWACLTREKAAAAAH